MITGSCHCGAVSWVYRAEVTSATACSCTICRRYGVLWAYGFIGQEIDVIGDTKAYQRRDGGAIDFHFCSACGCVTHYMATQSGEGGRYWAAVNLRMSEPGPIEDVPIRHFDGCESWSDLPDDGRVIRDMWF